jgi:hypothetical protein
LHALSSSHSDHCPLLLMNQSGPVGRHPSNSRTFGPNFHAFRKS